MDHIVNNTGIPTSEWGKYKPAGTKNTTVDFAALSKSAEDGGRELEEIVSKLSEGSKATLKRLKADPNSISKREWLDLTSELNRIGVLSDADYTGSGALFQLVPLGDMENRYTLTDDMRTTLNRLSQWSGNPFEHLDTWAFSLRKWASVLSLERDPDGSPKYQDFSPIYDQAFACDRASGLVKELMRVL